LHTAAANDEPKYEPNDALNKAASVSDLHHQSSQPNSTSASDATTAPTITPSKAALSFVFFTVVLDVLAIGLIIPVFPKLIERLAGGTTQYAAMIYGGFGVAFAVMQFLFMPVLGALSDRFGRRPIILLSNFGLCIDYLLMGFAPTLFWLFIGRILSGITAASITTANAYIADVTAPEKRAQAFGMIGAAFGLGFVVGPAAGGLLASVDPLLPFWVAAGLSFANFMYGLFVLPESLPLEKRSTIISFKMANPFGAMKLLAQYPQALSLAVVSFLSAFAHGVLPAVFVLYTGYRFQWTERDVGFTLALVGVCSALVQAVLTKKIIERFGERKTLIAGLVFGAIGFVCYGLAPSSVWIVATVPLMALWGLAGPTSQSIISRQVGPSDQGKLQGALSSVVAFTGIFAPFVFTGLFAYFSKQGAMVYLPGAAFLLAALLVALAAIQADRATRRLISTG
jgi:MFS transporter, DHA1 family, tetracycline resistance protein